MSDLGAGYENVLPFTFRAGTSEEIERHSSYMKKGLTGSTLKIIAMVAMLIDHIGAAVCFRMMARAGYSDLNGATEETIVAWVTANADLYSTYYIFRMIGRIAFPIFAFLLVEGFLHTQDVKKYAIRLFMFALLSEIPFDLAFQGKVLEFTHQNVFFTLAIGFVTMMVYKWIEEKQFQNTFTRYLLQILVMMAGMAVAQFLRTDYSALGVFAILSIYIFRNNKLFQIAAIGLVFIENMSAWFAFFPILLYNGKRGLNVKWVFYAFYPVHLLVLYGICCLMGLGAIPAI